MIFGMPAGSFWLTVALAIALFLPSVTDMPDRFRFWWAFIGWTAFAVSSFFLVTHSEIPWPKSRRIVLASVTSFLIGIVAFQLLSPQWIKAYRSEDLDRGKLKILTTSLSTENGRFFFNIQYVVEGYRPVTRLRFASAFAKTEAAWTLQQIDSEFEKLRTRSPALQATGEAIELIPGKIGQLKVPMYSEMARQEMITNEDIDKLKAGAMLFYAAIILKYDDSEGTRLTEQCSYFGATVRASTCDPKYENRVSDER
jgi:hypothetical protein